MSATPGPAENHRGIPRRSAADTDGDVARVLGKLESSGQDLTVLRILANSPKVFRPFLVLSSSLMYEADLPADVREAVILWLARRRRNRYEWMEHAAYVERLGLDRGIVEAIASDDLDPLTDDQRAAIDLADELLTQRGLSSATWISAVERWGVGVAIELVLAIAWWGGAVPVVLEALGLQAPDSAGTDIDPWPPDPPESNLLA